MASRKKKSRPRRRSNPASRNELREQLATIRQIHITVIGRTSGRRIRLPVWFVPQGTGLLLLPVRGSDTQWYRNVLRNTVVRVSARGLEAEFRAAPIRRATSVSSVIRKFGRNYGARIVKQLYFKFDVAVRLRPV